MRSTLANLLRNGIWLTFPPLIFSLNLMDRLPDPFSPALFNKGVSGILLSAENITRIFVFALPVFFSIGVSTKVQKQGLVLYLTGLALYFLSYGVLIIFPTSVWSTSMIGFTSAAYINAFWMFGLGLLGEKFYFPAHLRYHPIYYIIPSAIFLILHTTHAFIIYQNNF